MSFSFVSEAIRPYRHVDLPRLLCVWESAVRATHLFLTQEDIDFFRPYVEQVIDTLDVWVWNDATGVAQGFLGLDEHKIEMLFVHAGYFGQGIGRGFVLHAQGLHGTLLVDVNEQNPGGVCFYTKMGFVQIGRSERDASGKPFPLLHMERIV